MIFPLPRTLDLVETSANDTLKRPFSPRPNTITVVGADAAGFPYHGCLTPGRRPTR